MAQFVFKLQAVLRQREIIEQRCQRDVAAKHQVYVDLDGQLNALRDQVDTANLDLRSNRLVGRLDLNFLAAHRRFLNAMQRQAVGIAQKLAAAKQALDVARLTLAEATKQRRMIEKLRENQFARWKMLEQKKESALLDEVGMQLAYQNLQQESERKQ